VTKLRRSSRRKLGHRCVKKGTEKASADLDESDKRQQPSLLLNLEGWATLPGLLSKARVEK
jgi:hypothetical protein